MLKQPVLNLSVLIQLWWLGLLKNLLIILVICRRWIESRCGHLNLVSRPPWPGQVINCVFASIFPSTRLNICLEGKANLTFTDWDWPPPWILSKRLPPNGDSGWKPNSPMLVLNTPDSFQQKTNFIIQSFLGKMFFYFLQLSQTHSEK